VHRLAQVLPDDGVGFGDPGQGPADGLAHRDTGPLGLAGEGSRPPGEPGGAGQLGDEPGTFGPGLAGPMLSSTSTLRFRRASRHFLPTRWHSACRDWARWSRAAVAGGPETG